MSILMNGSSSNGKLGKGPLQNGSPTPDFKYKARKVSAVRDFPPGCGRFAPRINTTPEPPPDSGGNAETILSGSDSPVVLEDNLIKNWGSGSQSLEILKNDGTFDKESEEATAVVLDVLHDLQMMDNTEPGRTELPKLQEKGESTNQLEVSALESEKGFEDGVQDEKMISSGGFEQREASVSYEPISDDSGGSRPKKYPPRRRISAIRDFPPGCGRNALPKAEVKTGAKEIKKDPVIVGSSSENKVEKQSKEIKKDCVLVGPSSENKVEKKFTKEKSKSNLYRPDYKLQIVAKKSTVKSETVGPVKDSSLKRKFSSISTSKSQPKVEDTSGLEPSTERVIVQGLMASSNCPWRQGGKGNIKPGPTRGASGKKRESTEQGKSRVKFTNKSSPFGSDGAYRGKGELVVVKDDLENEDYLEHDEGNEGFDGGHVPKDFDVKVPRFTSINSSDRYKVREALRTFQAVCRKKLQEEETKSKTEGSGRRIDLEAAKYLKEKGKFVNVTGNALVGAVPGVEVGDEFHFRTELAVIGIHRPYQAGIDFVKQRGKLLCASIVAAGASDELDQSDVLVYSGSGVTTEDQKLERGNLSLKNSIDAQNPVRVIRGFKELAASESSDSRAKLVSTYIYDGLYLVEKYWQEAGKNGKMVFKFQLRRIEGQPELALKEVKKSKKSKVRVGLCVVDISNGKEKIPIGAVNTIDNDKPPKFNYITSVMYPDSYKRIPPQGCDCIDGCSDSEICSCAVKNGGEIPYNYNGAIVEEKSIVFECGPSCKCPPSCYNRVAQHGIKFQLEIFKTESRGWGVRSLCSIPSGSFICEYTGEILEDKEAEGRIGNDEYLFDIGHNYHDSLTSSTEVVEGGYTIDALNYGNVGRFVNHSCSPNLYSQNVLFDHGDKCVPHIMLFAVENIPPLQELTYDYNYKVDDVRDSNGEIKKKSCYCGSSECRGRMY